MPTIHPLICLAERPLKLFSIKYQTTVLYNIHPFGCTCFVHLSPHKCSKLSPKLTIFSFLVMELNIKVFIVLIPKSIVFVSPAMLFFCNISPIIFLLRLYLLTLLFFTLCLPLCICYWRACELAIVPPNLLSALAPRKYSLHNYKLVDYYSFIVSHHFSIAYKQFLAALHFHTEP